MCKCRPLAWQWATWSWEMTSKPGWKDKKHNLPLSRQYNLSIEDSHRKQRKIPTDDEQTIQSQSRTLAMGRVGQFNSKEHSSLKPWGNRIIRARQLDMFKMEEIKRNHNEAIEWVTRGQRGKPTSAHLPGTQNMLGRWRRNEAGTILSRRRTTPGAAVAPEGAPDPACPEGGAGKHTCLTRLQGKWTQRMAHSTAAQSKVWISSAVAEIPLKNLSTL